jgi:AAA+ superfamily predicted ATPase
MADPRRRFSPGITNFFFDRDEFDYAVGAVTQKLEAGAAVDASWLPQLVTIGGFQYERGRREFAEWAESIQVLLGGGVQALLRETWEAIPRSVAERFGAAINGGLADLELASLGRAYKQLQISFRQTRGDSIIEMMSSLAKLDETIHSSEPPAEPGNGESPGHGEREHAHRHLCISCGMPYGHEPWQCEPPDDQYCPMCAENVAGPIPIWIERWTESGDTESAVTEPAERKPSPVEADGAYAGAGTITAVGEAASPAPAESATTPVTVSVEKEADSPIPNPTKHGLAKVGGMDELKGMLYEEVVTAMRDPEDLKAYGLTIPNGILLFGPPGCGKTFISRALAEEMGYYFAEVFPSEIGSTFIHGTTLKIRELFDTAAERAPAIVFVDEFEGMVPARRELAAHQHQTAEEVSEFLKQLETCAERRILLIAATNEPWKIDPAVQRTGRLDKRIYVGSPDAAARSTILQFHLYGRRMTAIDADSMAKSLDGYSAADLKVLVDEAARLARKARQPISEEHLSKAARERVPPSITPQDEQRFRTFEQRGVDGPRRASHVLLPDDPSLRAPRRAPNMADAARRKS